MNLNSKMNKVAIIGAAGKMGSGISLLLLNLMSNMKLKKELPSNSSLVLIDISDEALSGLYQYLRTQMVKLAEKNINFLRETYADRSDLVENGEMIDEFISESLSIIRLTTALEAAKNATMVFEAATENMDIKSTILNNLCSLVDTNCFFYTNTSSIPISTLENIATLKGRIMGFHFYNPPSVQKLVEVIKAQNTRAEVNEFALELGKSLKKILVPSNDVAGFIGNGHFIRDGLYAISEVLRLQNEYTIHGAIHMLNRVSQDLMIRPMGIFQLIDYVGIDVFQLILKVMNQSLNENLQSALIDRYLAKEIKGGQFSNGQQKDGFLKYEKGNPVAVYSIDEDRYISLNEDRIFKIVDEKLYPLADGHSPWKNLLTCSTSDRDQKLNTYFKNLWNQNHLGAKLAKNYLLRSESIGKHLVDSKVANNAEDVNAVLVNGFYHLYGPINNLFPKEKN
ncbi:MAG: 3-hydroxyacyl-CoA dehydrogenase family protein [Oligoflexia bacterium]|nr:3-hydroxyacyl-CoA dehydrogenase family protein [Oligoflexia bacterium]